MNETNPNEHKFYSPEFIRLCVCSFLFFSSFNMIIAELPAYLTAMGGGEYKGWIIGLFTITAAFARPFSGKWADNIGRVPVILIGAAVSCLCGLAYVFISGIAAFLALRFIHGFSTGFTPTGTSAYAADISPVNRRGEAMGLLGLAGSLGMAAGPAIGSSLANYYSYDIMFYASAFTGLLAFVFMLGMKETLPQRRKFAPDMIQVKTNEIYEPRVLLPAVIMFLTVLAFGVVLTLVPDLCERLELKNKGVFFMVFTLCSVLVRFSAGRISDRVGREKVLLVSTSLLFISMILIANATSIFILMMGAAVFGFANGINSPTVMAWCIDRSEHAHVGRAMATVYIAMEIGIGAGAFISGWALDGTAENHYYIFLSAATFSLAAFFILLRQVLRKEKN